MVHMCVGEERVYGCGEGVCACVCVCVGISVCMYIKKISNRNIYAYRGKKQYQNPGNRR